MKYDIKCFSPAKLIKICEGGWQVPEVLRSYEECESIEEVLGEPVPTYCTSEEIGVNLEIENTINEIISGDTTSYPIVKLIDGIDLTSTILSNKTTVKWLYNVSNNSNDLRAGEIIAGWNENKDDVGFTDFSTSDVGDTSDVEFDVVINNNLVELKVISNGSNWKIKVTRSDIM